MNSPLIQGILHAANLIAQMSQAMTNGGTNLGTLQAPYLPKQLSSSSSSFQPQVAGSAWNQASVTSANPYTSAPNNTVVRSYTFDVSRGYLAPDGVNRSMLLINGQFPGPLIEANWGDTIQVTVRNRITGPEEGTSMHWHGILQKTSQWMDGVPAVSQCPIAPGKSFTYTFKADLYGSSWYHSHYSGQYAGGLLGPMIIHGANYDVDVGPVLLTDWYHKDYFSLVQDTMAVPARNPVSLNNLINGKMAYNCTQARQEAGLPDQKACKNFAGVAKFRFQTGKTHLLRLINAGSEGIQKFTLDGYNMTVIANDFVPVQPYTTNVVTLGVGQRTDVLVKGGNNASASFWMRSEISTKCSLTSQPVALAAVYYPNANTSSTPPSTPTNYTETTCGNDDLTKTIPEYKLAAPATPATTQRFAVSVGKNSSGNTLWAMNGQSFRANYNYPVLLLANSGNVSYPADPEWNVYNFGSNSSIRMVLENPGPVAHPFHLHGHNFMVFAEGAGTFTAATPSYRPANPQRRDTHILRPGSFAVLDIVTDNPGVWPFHCHIAWHVSAGLYVNVMERPADIRKLKIPSIMAQQCREWAAFTNTTVVDQIDSGLRLMSRMQAGGSAWTA